MTSSLSVVLNFRLLAVLPGGDFSLDNFYQTNQDYSQSHQHNDGNKELGRFKGVGVLDYHIPKAGDRSKELRHYHSYQATSDREVDASQDEWERGGNDEVSPELALGRAKGAAHLKEIRAQILHPLLGIEQDWKDHEQENDHHLGRNSKAEPKDDQRNKGHRRSRIDCMQIGLHGQRQSRGACQEDSERNPYYDSKHKRIEEHLKALPEVTLELSL